MAVRRRGTQTAGRRRVEASQNLSAVLAVFARDTHAGRNWGHAGLSRILKDVTFEEARWKPGPDAHSIWEEVNHIAYWSEDVLEQLEGRGKPRPQAWPPGEGGPDEWRRAVGRAGRLHGRLVRRIQAMRTPELVRKAQKSRYSNAQLILGGVAHISYHAGRIALLKRLRRAAAV
ncbi:MAG: DinB family protein [Armatimonadota bacterium]|nr:DinB family protein [Armatimonadota bacterium]